MDTTRTIRPLIAVALALVPFGVAAQPRLALEEAGSRTGHEFTPAHLRQLISVSGVVASRMYSLEDRVLLPIQDASNHGLVLAGTRDQFAAFVPGDVLEAEGTVGARMGMPVLEVSIVHSIGTVAPPAALALPIESLHSFAAVGMLVTTVSVLTAFRPNADGAFATLGEHGNFIHIFLQKEHRPTGGFSAGDRVRVTGTLIQHAKQPPFDGGFHIMLRDASGLVLVENRPFLPPLLLVSALAATSLMLIIWWIRERRMAMQRRSMRVLHSLSEDIIAAQTPADLAKRLAGSLPQVIPATLVRLYLFNSRTRSLERVISSVNPEPIAFAVDNPPPGMPTGVAVCFRNRRLLSIPDTRRSPFLKGTARSDMPRSALFVPMFTHQELLGVLELSLYDRPHFFTQEEQASSQHIGNQVATALKLQEQQAIREQLFRSEKLAATGQLISGVASELRNPLEAILKLANSLTASQSGGASRDLRALSAEARHASEIVSRLVSFARPEDANAKPVEVNHLLASLIEFRSAEWQKQGVHVHNRISTDRAFVQGAQGQLEQVFLNLLIHAEQCAEYAAGAGEKAITISSSLIARRILVEIGFPAAPLNGADPLADQAALGGSATAAGLAVCRGILQTHGGEVYFRPRGATAKFEVELPVESARATSVSGAPAKKIRPLTAMVIDPEASAQRQLVSLLSARGHRAVPVSSTQEAVDLVQRLRFDCVFFASRPANPAWMEMFDRIRAHTPATVLLTDGFDPELHRTGSEILALARPVQEPDLDRMLEAVGSRADGALAGRS